MINGTKFIKLNAIWWTKHLFPAWLHISTSWSILKLSLFWFVFAHECVGEWRNTSFSVDASASCYTNVDTFKSFHLLIAFYSFTRSYSLTHLLLPSLNLFFSQRHSQNEIEWFLGKFFVFCFKNSTKWKENWKGEKFCRGHTIDALALDLRSWHWC